jgi:hypothetical protein
MSRLGSVQAAHLQLESIVGGVVGLGHGRYRAILEVGGVAFGLLGERQQEAFLAAYSGWLNSLAYPVQVLVQVVPLNLAAYVGALERRARLELPAPLARLAHDYVTFLEHLAHERQLLERRHYVVVPAEDEAGPPRRWPWRPAPAEPAADAARRLLTTRCEEVTTRLRACDLAVRRLDSLELAQLWHACWRPEQARVARLQAELLEAAMLAGHQHTFRERSA